MRGDRISLVCHSVSSRGISGPRVIFRNRLNLQSQLDKVERVEKDMPENHKRAHYLNNANVHTMTKPDKS